MCDALNDVKELCCTACTETDWNRETMPASTPSRSNAQSSRRASSSSGKQRRQDWPEDIEDDPYASDGQMEAMRAANRQSKKRSANADRPDRSANKRPTSTSTFDACATSIGTTTFASASASTPARSKPAKKNTNKKKAVPQCSQVGCEDDCQAMCLVEDCREHESPYCNP